MIDTPHTRKLKTVKFNINEKYGKHSSHAGFRDSPLLFSGKSKIQYFSFSVFQIPPQIGEKHTGLRYQTGSNSKRTTFISAPGVLNEKPDTVTKEIFVGQQVERFLQELQNWRGDDHV